MNPLMCPRCLCRMERIGEGWYKCPEGHRWLDDSPDLVDSQPIEEHWIPAGRSLSYVPGTVHGGGGKSGRGKSPAKQKMEAYQRRAMKGASIRSAPVEPTRKPPPK